MGCVHPSCLGDPPLDPPKVDKVKATPDKGSQDGAGSKRLDGEQESRTKGAPARSPANGGVAQVASASEGLQPQEEPPPLLPPTPLPTGKTVPRLSEASRLLREEDLAALTAALPGLHRLSPWRLLYSTWRDGISLSTLYRKAVGPCILVVRDRGKFVFGCFTPQRWRLAPGYYGTGQSFVFTLQPTAAIWRWHERRMAVTRNDFFQLSRPEYLALGGGPNYALYLDGELHGGSSGDCHTFGSPCLASSPDFQIGHLEMWGLV